MLGNLIGIKSKKLHVPKLWDHDWQKIINDASELEKELIFVQARGANLLKNINDYDVNFSRLAWVNLWTKAFNILDGAFNAVNCNSDTTLHLLSRSILEYDQHIFTIFEGIDHEKYIGNSNIKILDKDRLLRIKIINRLKAFSAWCLWSDKEYLEFCLKHAILNQIYDEKTLIDLSESFKDENEKRLYENLFGKLPTTTRKKELQKDRMKAQDYGQSILNYINHLFKNDQELKEWNEKLSQLSTTNTGRRSVCFYELFNKSENSFHKKLNNSGMGFAYSDYKLGSMYMHNSSFTNSFYFQTELITPQILHEKSNMKIKALHVSSRCNNAFVLLATIQKELWKTK